MGSDLKCGGLYYCSGKDNPDSCKGGVKAGLRSVSFLVVCIRSVNVAYVSQLRDFDFYNHAIPERTCLG